VAEYLFSEPEPANNTRASTFAAWFFCLAFGCWIFTVLVSGGIVWLATGSDAVRRLATVLLFAAGSFHPSADYTFDQ
jgi:hypothetical protein